VVQTLWVVTEVVLTCLDLVPGVLIVRLVLAQEPLFILEWTDKGLVEDINTE
jgi:hypothetical protein